MAPEAPIEGRMCSLTEVRSDCVVTGWVFAFVILETSRGKVTLAAIVWETRLENKPAAFTLGQWGIKRK